MQNAKNRFPKMAPRAREIDSDISLFIAVSPQNGVWLEIDSRAE